MKSAVERGKILAMCKKMTSKNDNLNTWDGVAEEIGSVDQPNDRANAEAYDGSEPRLATGSTAAQIKRYVLIGCGALWLNLMYVLVTVPYGIINGGVTSMSMILSRLPLTGVLPVNAWVAIVTGILLALCGLFLGKENFIGSIFSCVCGVGGFNLFTLAVPDALHNLIFRFGEFGPLAKAGLLGFSNLSDSSLLYGTSAPVDLFGGALIPPVGTIIELILAAIGVGFGYYLCISNNATAVGMDTIALILHKKNEKIPVAWAMYAINIIVLLLGLATYGLIGVLMGIAFAGVQAASLNAFLKLGTGEKRQSDGDDFVKMLDEAQEWASSVGYQESDVNAVIKSTRKRKHK